MTIALVLLSLVLGPKVVRAQGPNSAMLSPDRTFLAMTVHGDADCQYLLVAKVDPKRFDNPTLLELRKAAERHSSGKGPKPPATQLDRMDVNSFVWIPQYPHTLVYGESAIYGDGVVALWHGGTKRRVIDHPKNDEAVIMLLRYTPKDHRLLYEISTPRRNPNQQWRKRTRSVKLS
ncbi:MAG: hypothetical protein ACHQ50_08705 [Fimbriimonadales bacterium]